MLETPSLFDVMEHDDTQRRVASRSALALAKARTDQQLGRFLRAATTEDEFEERLALVLDDFTGIVESSSAETGHERPEHVAKALKDHYRLEASLAPPVPVEGLTMPPGRIAGAFLAATAKKALSSQDFVLIADAIRTAPPGADPSTLAQHFAQYLAQTSPNFDQNRFLQAAGATSHDTFQAPGTPTGDGTTVADPSGTAPPSGVQFSSRQWIAKPLTEEDRKELDSDEFVFPKDKRYPIEDKQHAQTAEAYAEGTKEEATVDRAVQKKYPGFGKDKKDKESAAQNPSDQNDDASRLVSCPECGGDGKTAGDQKCGKCDGKGRVPNFGDSMIDALSKTADKGNTDLDGPEPKMDKRLWTPESVKEPEVPGDLKRKDIIEPIKAVNDAKLEEIGEGHTERETLPSNSGDAGFGTGGEDFGPHTDTWHGDGGLADPVTRSAISKADDVERNPLHTLLTTTDGFPSDIVVQSALTRFR